MNYKRSKYFTTSNNKKIKYLFIKKNSEITVVFFHGFMSDMKPWKKTTVIWLFFLISKYLIFLLLEVVKYLDLL